MQFHSLLLKDEDKPGFVLGQNGVSIREEESAFIT